MLVFNSKKGVSPLIATILLIAFAVALGAVVMQLGAGLASDECSSDLQLSVKGFPCVDGNKVKLSLKNSGNSNIDGVNVWIYGANEGIKTKNIDELIPTSGTFNIDIEYDKSIYGEVSQIDIIPKYKKDSELLSCDNAKIEIDQISKC